MQYPDRFSDLPEYAFPRLRALLDGVEPGGDPVAMSIGEPQFPFPGWVTDEITAHAAGFGKYPVNEGAAPLLQAISDWVARRYGVRLDPETRLMALNGTREGLYNVAMALCPERKGAAAPAILIPNPFYQVYAVAAASVGAEPVFVPATEATDFLPDFAGLPGAALDRTALVYLCSPSNPQGAVASRAYMTELLALAERHDFRIVADECYGEIYRGEAPPGLLEVADAAGADPERVLAFHSLSKRSGVPGLRSGFVASGPDNIARIRRLRAYAGAPLPLPLQAAAIRLWSDEAHVEENRRLYARNFAEADAVLQGVAGFASPPAGFFLWLPVESGEAATVRLWREAGVKVLPGSYLCREIDGLDPGRDRIRVALVADQETVTRGLSAIRTVLYE